MEKNFMRVEKKWKIANENFFLTKHSLFRTEFSLEL